MIRKIGFVILLVASLQVSAQRRELSAKELKKMERRERINQLIKQEEEGALIYNKQGIFGIRFNTDGYGIMYEKGKYKMVTKTNLWWLEFGERRHKKEEKLTVGQVVLPGFIIGNPFIYGKVNNFFYLKLGFGQQRLIGGKGNKNGVAVSAVYGGGLSAAILKPYYIEVEDPLSGQSKQIKYDNTNDAEFLDANSILGSAGIFKGVGESKFQPGGHLKAGVRFDYGRFNETVSALEVGLRAEYYSQPIKQMLLQEDKKLFWGAYVNVLFGRRK